MTTGLQIYSADGATLLFELDPSDVVIDDQKSVEPMEIPGQMWNTYFDSVSVVAKWTFTGTFVATNDDWDTANTKKGRPFDFMQRLRAAMKSVDVSTGNYLGSPPKYDTFVLVCNMNFPTIKSWNLSSAYSANPVQFVFQNMNLKIVGGEPGKVDYTINFLEVLEIVRLG